MALVRVTRAVLLDALGTLLELEDPGPPLAAQLGRLGAPVSVEDARSAVRAEMTYYRAHHDEASDRERLEDLRRRCAGVLRDALPAPARELGVPALTEALLAALRFRPYQEVPAALRELRSAGLRLVVVSNWDVSLHDQLAATGLRELVDGAVSSAEVGAGKPHPAVFARALEVAGVPAPAALMVGDSPETDVEGALAAGIPAVLLDRWAVEPPTVVGFPAHGGRGRGAGGGERVPVVRSLAELPALIESRA